MGNVISPECFYEKDGNTGKSVTTLVMLSARTLLFVPRFQLIVPKWRRPVCTTFCGVWTDSTFRASVEVIKRRGQVGNAMKTGVLSGIING